MLTTIEFLDAVKARHGLTSDYQLAKTLGITRESVSLLRNGKTFLGDSTALKVAKLLGEQPGVVLAAVHAQRAKDEEEKTAWTEIFEKLGGIAAGVMVAIGGATLPAGNAYAAAISALGGVGVCVLC